MLKGQDIVCVSTIDWDFVWQGHQEIMSTLAANGNRVIFVENTGVRTPTCKDVRRLAQRFSNWRRNRRGFRECRDNLFIYSPMVLPFPYSKPARWLNKKLLIKPLVRWMHAQDFRNPIIWTYLPTHTTIDIADSIEHKMLLYYCVADFALLSDNPGELRAVEETIMKRSRIIFTPAKELADHCGRLNKNVHVFPNGVNTTVFDASRISPREAPPEDLRGLRRPVIGYVGGVHKFIDFDLLREIALLRPTWTLALIGPIQADTTRLEVLPNIRLLGQRAFSALPAYVAGFDACIIPYQVSAGTRTVCPSKLNEYHAMGKPVVSTGLPEVLAFNERNDGIVYVASDAGGFVRGIEDAMKADSPRLAQARIDSARRNGWAARIERMSALLEKELLRHA